MLLKLSLTLSHIHTYIHTHMHSYIHTHALIHTHTCTHKVTCTHARVPVVLTDHRISFLQADLGTALSVGAVASQHPVSSFSPPVQHVPSPLHNDELQILVSVVAYVNIKLCSVLVSIMYGTTFCEYNETK